MLFRSNTSSRIISKGIAAGRSDNTYRGLVSAHRKALNARNFTQCDSLLIGDKCGAHTVPYIEAKTSTAQFEHEATTSKISDDQMFYCMSRGLSQEEAVALIVNGFVRDVLAQVINLSGQTDTTLGATTNWTQLEAALDRWLRARHQPQPGDLQRLRRRRLVLHADPCPLVLRSRPPSGVLTAGSVVEVADL